jgi:hypothetical protein
MVVLLSAARFATRFLTAVGSRFQRERVVG